MTRSIRLLLFLALVAAIAGCGSESSPPVVSGAPPSTRAPEPTMEVAESSFPVEIAADNGAVTVDARPERVVSLSTVSTEILFAIGAGDQVIAVDSQSTYPAEAPVTDLSSYTPNIEAIAALDPDLVFLSFDPTEVVDGLTALGIPVIMHGTGMSLEHAYEQIAQTGAATGHADEAAALVASTRERIRAAVAATPELDPAPSIYHEISYDLWSATSATFIGQVYALFGVDNISDAADDTGGGFPQLSAEYILDADPDLIFLGDVLYGESAETVAARPGWSDLTAVRSGFVVELDTDVASRWGPRVGDLIEAVAAAFQEWSQRS